MPSDRREGSSPSVPISKTLFWVLLNLIILSLIFNTQTCSYACSIISYERFQFTFLTLQNIFKNQIKRIKKIAQITHEDFEFFQTELLQVDLISFNITKLFEFKLNQLIAFFQNLGFDCYLKKNRYKSISTKSVYY